MGSEVHEFGIKVLLDGHGLDEIQEIALEFGDLIHPDDGIDIHELLIGTADAGDHLAILVLILDVNYGGGGCMHHLVREIELQVGYDITDLQQQAPVFEVERNACSGIVLDPAGVFYLLEVIEANSLAGVTRLNRIS